MDIHEYLELISKNFLFSGYKENKEISNISNKPIFKILTKYKKFPLRYKSHVVIFDRKRNFEDILEDVQFAIGLFDRKDRLAIVEFADADEDTVEKMSILTKQKNLLMHVGGGQVLFLINIDKLKAFIITEGRVVSNPYRPGFWIVRQFYELLQVRKIVTE